MIKRILFVAPVLFLWFCGRASATPIPPTATCTAGTLAAYIALGTTGCSIGQIGFHSFAFSVLSSGGGATPISDSAISVSPLLSGSKESLTFSSSGFSVTGTEFVSYLISYTTDPHPIIIDALEELFAFSPVFPGLASITTDLCVGAAFIGTTCSGTLLSLNVFDDGVTSQLVDFVSFGGAVDIVGVRHTILLQANGASADFASFKSTLTAVPEPSSLVLLGSGLLVFIVWGRRRLSG